MHPELTNILLDSIGLTLSIVLLIITRYTAKYVAYDQRIFHKMLFFTFLLNLLDFATIFMRPTGDLLVRIYILLITTVMHGLQLVVASLWVHYVDFKTFQSESRFRGSYGWLLNAPLAVVSVLLVVNMFTGMFFSISADGYYQPTSAVYFLHGLSLLYAVYGMIVPLTEKSSWRNYIDFPAPLFLLPVLAGNAAHLYLGNISVSWVAMAVGFVFLQLTLQNDVGYMDPLTGLHNRHFLNQHLQNMIHRVEEPESNKQLAGILIDMDGFKELNDNFGHMTGDLALQDMGQILRNSLPLDAVACRFGGDEFIVIAVIDKREDVLKILEAIQTHTERQNNSGIRNFSLHMSVGWTLYARRADTVDSFFSRMDDKMYREKEMHHEQMAAERLTEKEPIIMDDP